MKNLALIGRILFALPFIAFGLMHLTDSAKMAEMVLKDWPMAQGLVIISGIAMLAGGISIIINKMAKWGSLGIAVLMLIMVVSLHLPNAMSDDENAKMMGMISTLKDLGLMGGALFLAWYFDRKDA